MVKISSILQKGNSVGLKCWGCSAFEVLASVAIERPARERSAKAVSAILHSCIIAQESRECSHNAQFCTHSFGKGFCSVPVLPTLFYRKKQSLYIKKVLLGTIIELKPGSVKRDNGTAKLARKSSENKNKKTFSAEITVFIVDTRKFLK